MVRIITPRKQSIIGVGVSQTSYEEVVALCEAWSIEHRTTPVKRSRYICVTSVHGVIMAQDDAEMAEVLNQADVVTPDGMPIVWAMRSFGCENQDRVYGPTLMLKLCENAAETGQRIFLYGARPDTLRELQRQLLAHFPKLVIAGSFAPPFRPLTKAEEKDVKRRILASDADIVFVGIGTPKQEKWMYAHRQCFPGMTMIGVGAAFDFHAGMLKQAPLWMQRNGLEWLFRLIMEPARLWKRYILITPRFLPLWALQKLKSARLAPTRAS